MTVVYSAECKAIQRASRSTGTLPILVVLFLISYGIFTALVIEQTRTIDAQRSLIREMLKDSNQLAALKGKLAHDESVRARQQAQAAAGQSDSQNGQKDGAGAPKAADKDGKRSGKSTHTTKQAPGRPPSDLEDVRRSTRII